VGKRVHTLETQISETEQRMQALASNETALRASLSERRGVLAEVLGALQRMGHRPPPAILVRPEDALASVRRAIMLGAVVPELRDAADRLSLDLRELLSLRTEIARERGRLHDDATALAEDRKRIELLIAEKQRQRESTLAKLADEEKRASLLADQATGLRDLIALIEKQI